MATIAIMVDDAMMPFLMQPLSLVATISRKLYLVTVDKLHWMKKSGMTKPLRHIKQPMQNTKRIAQNSLTGLQHKIG